MVYLFKFFDWAKYIWVFWLDMGISEGFSEEMGDFKGNLE
jgi:hypothetical protein